MDNVKLTGYLTKIVGSVDIHVPHNRRTIGKSVCADTHYRSILQWAEVEAVADQGRVPPAGEKLGQSE